MSQMVERVARVIAPHAWEFEDGTPSKEQAKQIARNMAREVLQAMREPTRDMVAAGFDVGKPPFGIVLVGSGAAGCWDGMIKAALAH